MVQRWIASHGGERIAIKTATAMSILGDTDGRRSDLGPVKHVDVPELIDHIQVDFDEHILIQAPIGPFIRIVALSLSLGLKSPIA